MRNASATGRTPMPPTNVSEKRNLEPKRPLIAAPSSGSRGTSQMYLYMSPLQQIDLVYPDGFLVSIKRDDDAHPDRRFSSSHDKHEHRENLARNGVHAAGFLQVA